MRRYFQTDFNYGVVLVLLGAILWGVTYPLWRVLSQQINPLVLTSITYLFASILIFVIQRLSVNRLYQQFLENKFWLLVMGLFSGALGSPLLCFALSRTDSGIVSILEKLQPIFTVLTARIFLGDLISWRKMPWMFLSILLAGIISVGNPFELNINSPEMLGLLAAVASAFFFGSDTVISKHLINRNIPSKDLVFYRMFIGGVLSTVVAFFFTDTSNVLAPIDFNTLCLIILASYLTLVLAFELFFAGLKHIDSSTASYLELVTPAFAVVCGMIFLSERLDVYQVCAMPVFFYCIFKLSVAVDETGRVDVV